MLHYDSKQCISKTLWINLLKTNNDNFLANHFGFEKSLELLICKYYWQKIRANIEKYIQICNTCMSNKVQRHKSYGNFQLLSV